MSEKISTSALAKMRKVEAKLLFADLKLQVFLLGILLFQTDY